MADVPNKMYWMGQPIDDMPRDELIQIISDLDAQLAGHYTPNAIRARALGSVEMIKRGEVKDNRPPSSPILSDD